MSRTCPKCGTENPDSAKFCFQCAHAFVMDDGYAAPQEEAAAAGQYRQHQQYQQRDDPDAPREESESHVDTSHPTYASTYPNSNYPSSFSSTQEPSSNQAPPRSSRSGTLWVLATVVLGALLIVVGVAWLLTSHFRHDLYQDAYQALSHQPPAQSASTPASNMPAAAPSAAASAQEAPSSASAADQAAASSAPASAALPNPAQNPASNPLPMATHVNIPITAPDPASLTAASEAPAASDPSDMSQPPTASASTSAPGEPEILESEDSTPAVSTNADTSVLETAPTAQQGKNATQVSGSVERRHRQHHRRAAPRRLCPDRRSVAYDACITSECKKPGNARSPQCVQFQQRVDALHNQMGNQHLDCPDTKCHDPVYKFK